MLRLLDELPPLLLNNVHCSSYYLLYLGIYCVWYKHDYTCFSLHVICLEFHPFTLSLCHWSRDESSADNTKLGLVLLIHPATLYFLIGKRSPFTFRLIIYDDLLQSSYLSVCSVSHFSFPCASVYFSLLVFYAFNLRFLFVLYFVTQLRVFVLWLSLGLCQIYIHVLFF